MNIYHVIYASSNAESEEVYVIATTQQNAADAAQAADTGWQQLISIRQIASGTVIQGS
jgi:hypothetical protein